MASRKPALPSASPTLTAEQAIPLIKGQMSRLDELLKVLYSDPRISSWESATRDILDRTYGRPDGSSHHKTADVLNAFSGPVDRPRGPSEFQIKHVIRSQNRKTLLASYIGELESAAATCAPELNGNGYHQNGNGSGAHLSLESSLNHTEPVNGASGGASGISLERIQSAIGTLDEMPPAPPEPLPDSWFREAFDHAVAVAPEETASVAQEPAPAEEPVALGSSFLKEVDRVSAALLRFDTAPSPAAHETLIPADPTHKIPPEQALPFESTAARNGLSAGPALEATAILEDRHEPEAAAELGSALQLEEMHPAAEPLAVAALEAPVAATPHLQGESTHAVAAPAETSPSQEEPCDFWPEASVSAHQTTVVEPETESLPVVESPHTEGIVYEHADTAECIAHLEVPQPSNVQAALAASEEIVLPSAGAGVWDELPHAGTIESEPVSEFVAPVPVHSAIDEIAAPGFKLEEELQPAAEAPFAIPFEADETRSNSGSNSIDELIHQSLAPFAQVAPAVGPIVDEPLASDAIPAGTNIHPAAVLAESAPAVEAAVRSKLTIEEYVEEKSAVAPEAPAAPILSTVEESSSAIPALIEPAHTVGAALVSAPAIEEPTEQESAVALETLAAPILSTVEESSSAIPALIEPAHAVGAALVSAPAIEEPTEQESAVAPEAPAAPVLSAGEESSSAIPDLVEPAHAVEEIAGTQLRSQDNFAPAPESSSPQEISQLSEAGEEPIHAAVSSATEERMTHEAEILAENHNENPPAHQGEEPQIEAISPANVAPVNLAPVSVALAAVNQEPPLAEADPVCDVPVRSEAAVLPESESPSDALAAGVAPEQAVPASPEHALPGNAVHQEPAYNFHAEIDRVTSEPIREGDYARAVSEAYLRLMQEVKSRSGLPLEGDSLMIHVFDGDSSVPSFAFSSLSSNPQACNPPGVLQLFKGIVGLCHGQGLGESQTGDPRRAHEYLALASLLMRLLQTQREQT